MIGSVVLATDQGLGYLAKDFYDNGVIDKVYVHPHTTRENHYDWYPERYKDFVDLLDNINTLLLFETPFDTNYIKLAQMRGIKVVFMPMYECTRPVIARMADRIINPSALDQKHYPEGIFVTVPVPSYIQWKHRKKAKVFVHNAGNGGLGGRNGTTELLKAMKYVKNPIKLIIRSQKELENKIRDKRIEYRVGTFRNDTLYSEGDVFVFPEKFNGLSLPIQEAYASGMAVMCGDRFPMNAWLPTEPMIPVKKYQKQFVTCHFDSAVYDPKDIADTIDKWYNNDISFLSLKGKEWGEMHSWDRLKDLYRELCLEQF